MEINDLMKVLEDSKEQLTHILNNCKEGPAELVLLASKMGPVLENFSAIEAELFSSASTSEVPTEPQTEVDTPSHE